MPLRPLFALMLALAGACSSIPQGPSNDGGAALTDGGANPIDGAEPQRTGLWSDPATWPNGLLPTANTYVVIESGQAVIFDLQDAEISGLMIAEGGTLAFKSDTSATLRAHQNVVVHGKLEMKPDDATVVHALRFLGVDESQFVGGGMDVLATDVGLWVQDTGVLDLAGSPKTSWMRLGGDALSGSSTITLEAAPIGWQVGDELSIAPTEAPAATATFYDRFDERRIVAVSGSTVTLDAPLTYDHPAVADPFENGVTYRAEVLNLTRNVNLEGAGDGSASPTQNARAHVMLVMVQQASHLSNVQIRYMGPRQPATPATEGVLGRYGLHFHHCMDGSRGSTVDGVVVRDSGTHAFVPHASHGISFTHTIAYNTFDDAYWCDPSSDVDQTNNSNDILFDHTVAARTKADPPYRGYRLGSFVMGSGGGNVIEHAVAVGNQGNAGAAGFLWPEAANYTENVWTFAVGNVAHNNKTDGIFVWENDPHGHHVSNFVAFRNGSSGIEHGAYVNAYKFVDVRLFENRLNGFQLHSLPIATGPVNPEGYIVELTRLQSTDALEIVPHTLPAAGPTLLKDCSFPRVVIHELPRRTATPAPGLFDFVNCNLEPSDFDLQSLEVGARIRVQRDDQTAYEIDDQGMISTISAFY